MCLRSRRVLGKQKTPVIRRIQKEFDIYINIIRRPIICNLYNIKVYNVPTYIIIAKSTCEDISCDYYAVV